MKDVCTVVVLITIDTSKGIGSTTVYGEHEILEMLKAGAKTRGYTVTASIPVTTVKLAKDTYIGVIANIDKESTK